MSASEFDFTRAARNLFDPSDGSDPLTLTESDKKRCLNQLRLSFNEFQALHPNRTRTLLIDSFESQLVTALTALKSPFPEYSNWRRSIDLICNGQKQAPEDYTDEQKIVFSSLLASFDSSPQNFFGILSIINPIAGHNWRADLLKHRQDIENALDVFKTNLTECIKDFCEQKRNESYCPIL